MKKLIKKLKRKNGQSGVISVFLTIILVPSIVMSSIFVDLGRVQLAKGVSSSAADLALNSLMAHYDADLKDLYGMMASCQDIDQFYEETSNYFINALHSQGLSSEDMDSLIALGANAISSATGEDSFSDLLRMENQTESTEIISGVSGANLGNATIIKDQMVEFMKYRGPIEITKGIIQRLKDSNADDVLGKADENEELVEKKKKYGEAENELLQAAFEIYKNIHYYLGQKTTNTWLKNTVAENVKKYRELYRESVKLYISNLHNTSSLDYTFVRTKYGLDKYDSLYKKTSQKVHSHTKDVQGEKKYFVDFNRVKSLVEGLKNASDEFESAKNTVVSSATDELINANTGSGDSQINEIQWWVSVHSKINSGENSPLSKFDTKAKNMLIAYSKVESMMKCEFDKDVPENWKSQLDYGNVVNKAKNLQKKYLTGSTDTSDKYIKLVSKLENISKNNVGKVKSESLKLSNGSTIGSTMNDISSKVKSYRETLEKAIGYLDLAIDGESNWFVDDVPGLDDLKDLVKKYNTALENWKTTAKNTDTTMADEDLAEINGMGEYSKEKHGIVKIKEEDINKLKSRLTNIRTKLQSVLDSLNKFKFGNKSLEKITDYNTFKGIFSNSVGDVPKKNSDISQKAETIFKENFQVYDSNKNKAAITIDNFEDANYDPELTVSKPKLYDWMEKNFHDKLDDSEVDDMQKKVDGEKDSSKRGEARKEDEKTNRAGSDVSETNIYGGSYTGGNFPSGLNMGSPFALGSSFISGFANLAKSLIKGKFSGIRDSLYSTEYVMDMFSYSTYTNEGKFNRCKEKGLKLDEDSYPDVAGEEKGLWGSKDITDTYNQSLTNLKINSDNNVAYGAEAEYILYGNTNKDSIKSAYADIFTIRYALNLISGFQHFWSATNPKENPTGVAIGGIAEAVSSITSGIVPAPLTKAVLIAVITVAETGNDLDRLKKGYQVELYKGKIDQWCCSMSNTGANGNWESNDSAKESKNDDGLFYSDYIYLFLYLGFESDSAEQMYKRVGDVIQANMIKKTKDSSYSLKKSKVYFKVNADIRVSPLMLSLPISAKYKDGKLETTDWCTYNISEKRGYS